jgi:hypothetical protein
VYTEPTSAPIANGQIIREKLPLPIVHYPGEFGVFLAFAPSRRHTPRLCSCARPAVENYLKLRADLYGTVTFFPDAVNWFPNALKRRLYAWDGLGEFPVQYAEGVCHNCNDIAPTLAYCSETHGSPFIQAYGWYVNQLYLQLGILPHRCAYLPEVCPPAYQSEIETTRRLEQDFRDQCNLILDRLQDPYDDGFSLSESLGCADLTREDIRRMMELRHRASTARRQLKRKIEAVAARDFTAQGRVYAHL